MPKIVAQTLSLYMPSAGRGVWAVCLLAGVGGLLLAGLVLRLAPMLVPWVALLGGGFLLVALLTGLRHTFAQRARQVAPDPQGEAGWIEGLALPLIRFDDDGNLSHANGEARHLLDLAPSERPEPARLFVDLGRPVREWIVDVAAGRLPGGTETVALRNAKGAEEGDRFVQVALRSDGRGGALAVLQDATALKRIEAQVLQGQKMQAIGQLAGGISHDFNNLLTAITGHCDLMLLRHRSDDPDHADLIQIRQNANRAAALVSQLLAFSRKQTLKPERIDLQDSLADLTHLLNRLLGEKVVLELVHGAEPLAIRADRRQFDQVIMNLVVNARDAMPDGGVVQVQTRLVTLTKEMRRDRAVVPRGRHVVISVEDGGHGIPPDRIGKIFDPFFTTKRPGEGTGLGLSMVYGIVKQSGAFVFVESTPGVGTQFELWFPYCTEPAVPAGAGPARSRPGARTGGVVLLVEDEAPVRTFAARALRLRGLSVLEAASAEEALAILDDGGLRVDVFVTDVVMPGLDGPGWVQRALERRPGTRTVFMSGYAEEALADLQARIPGSVFLPKPFSLSDLTETVQAQMAA